MNLVCNDFFSNRGNLGETGRIPDHSSIHDLYFQGEPGASATGGEPTNPPVAQAPQLASIRGFGDVMESRMSCPAFDADATLARVGGNRELLPPMVGVFAIQWNNLWEEIARASQRRDGAALELTAHRLKESMESLGAREAGRLAQDLEARGRTNEFHNVDKSCASLKTAIDRLVNGLKEFAKQMVRYGGLGTPAK